MVRKAWFQVLLALVLVALGLTAGAPSSAQEVTLRFNRWGPPTHHIWARMMSGWIEQVEKVSQGRVKIEFTPASLGPPQRQFELAMTGVADITVGNQTSTAERFVLSRVSELPFIGDSAEAISVAHWRVHEKFLQKVDEYKGTKLITVFNNGPIYIYTTNQPVASIADLKNLKVRVSPGTGTDIAKALGMVPVAGAITESHDMLSRKVVDGTYMLRDAVKSFRLEKIVGHQLSVPLGLYNAAYFVVMNEAKWNALSKANQDAIMSVSGERFAREAGRIWDDQDKQAEQAFLTEGMKIAVASDAMRREMRERLQPIEGEWIKEAQSRGVDGKAALEMLRREIAGYRP